MLSSNFTSYLENVDKQIANNELDYEQATEMISKLNPQSLMERKELMQIKKRVQQLQKDEAKEKIKENLNSHIFLLRELLEKSRNVNNCVERYKLLSEAEEQKKITEALIYTLNQYKDHISQKFVGDCKKVILEYEEELRQSFVSAKREEAIFLTNQKSFAQSMFVSEIEYGERPISLTTNRSMRAKIKQYFIKVLGCLTTSNH
ncbi:unnamed protein product (macronuclear) [Paramecium tetraurelia]|uniref:Uncharacterized protein n=1 Tax=Paramecium tetraurelia TaxID=5888 RepID=A0E565_PARTE|nr:uncharacterized protein GSPATT00023609001 [Paramecium tetraurelia]CAK90432.1 unnamed protein product [Paramecium tetraurelia]|eukprot:XP_001457829.1 hypothetical protein (macronuclear) [Paramecium tetraurelia strain d4-2]